MPRDIHPDVAPLVQHTEPRTGAPYGERPDSPFVSEPLASKPKRHPATLQLLRFFEYEHLPQHLQATSRGCHQLAHAMVDGLPDGPELSAGLRKLLEAKDCFVRAALPQ